MKWQVESAESPPRSAHRGGMKRTTAMDLLRGPRQRAQPPFQVKRVPGGGSFVPFWDSSTGARRFCRMRKA